MGQKVALLSVSNKKGLAEFAVGLVEIGYRLLSTGGTARCLREAGVEVDSVSDFTGAPEMMNGRVKTLHPKIHGGILGDRVKHQTDASLNGVEWIDLVVVNLYPFEQTILNEVGLETAVETIDIGGPTMVRAAAKNHAHVAVVVDPSDYLGVLQALREEALDQTLRTRLAVKAFQHTARYDAIISGWLSDHADLDGFPQEQSVGLALKQRLRYGENPHQKAVFYADWQAGGRSLADIVQHQGKELSFNNLGDLDGALRTVFEFSAPAVAIIKHMNPAGCATAETPVEAFKRALLGDPVSAFGGVVVFNRSVGVDEVRAIKESKTFFEIVAAPGFSELALERLKTRKKLRVLELPTDWADRAPNGMDARRVQGGWLFQEWDVAAEMAYTVATDRAPTDEEVRALAFAWKACRNVKSNAIVFARGLTDGAMLNGVGAGQMSRVDSVRIAVSKATADIAGCVMASDAFFPFPDGVEVAAEAGITAIIQPGGSIRDEDVIAAANRAGMAMVMTGTRHFRH
jgi:phosphoribosylaminoimidazolecarboxamide formyltransferase/IMP cyclohydrolase